MNHLAKKTLLGKLIFKSERKSTTYKHIHTQCTNGHMCDIVNSTPSRPLQAGVMKMTCVSLTLSMTSMLLFTPRPRVFQLCSPTCMVRYFPLLCKIPWLSLIVSLFLSPSFVRNLILQNIASFHSIFSVPCTTCVVSTARGTNLGPDLLQKFRQFSLDTGILPENIAIFPKNGTSHLCLWSVLKLDNISG